MRLDAPVNQFNSIQFSLLANEHKKINEGTASKCRYNCSRNVFLCNLMARMLLPFTVVSLHRTTGFGERLIECGFCHEADFWFRNYLYILQFCTRLVLQQRLEILLVHKIKFTHYIMPSQVLHCNCTTTWLISQLKQPFKRRQWKEQNNAFEIPFTITLFLLLVLQRFYIVPAYKTFWYRRSPLFMASDLDQKYTPAGAPNPYRTKYIKFERLARNVFSVISLRPFHSSTNLFFFNQPA